MIVCMCWGAFVCVCWILCLYVYGISNWCLCVFVKWLGIYVCVNKVFNFFQWFFCGCKCFLLLFIKSKNKWSVKEYGKPCILNIGVKMFTWVCQVFVFCVLVWVTTCWRHKKTRCVLILKRANFFYEFSWLFVLEESCSAIFVL